MAAYAGAVEAESEIAVLIHAAAVFGHPAHHPHSGGKVGAVGACKRGAAFASGGVGRGLGAGFGSKLLLTLTLGGKLFFRRAVQVHEPEKHGAHQQQAR